MKVAVFQGGLVLPADESIQEKPVEQLPIPKRLTIPLKQYIGTACDAKVKKGEEVKLGQMIGEGKDPNSARTHATTSGKVAEVVKRFPDGKGGYTAAVVIEPDGKDEWAEPPKQTADYLQKSPDDLMALIQQGGLVDFDIDTVPLHIKLNQAKEKSVNTVIINSIDIEPYLAARYRLLTERSQDIVSGVEIIKKILTPSSICVAVSEDASKVGSAISGDAISVASLKARFPQALEKLLIKSILNREISPGGMAFDVGAAVFSVESVLGVLDAVRDGKPVVEKAITVGGPAISNPKNLRVRLGTSIEDVVEHCGVSGTYRKVILGGPLLGIAQYNTEISITKETSGLFVQTEAELPVISTEKCFNCGMCVSVCPARVLPHVISAYCEIGDFEKAQDNYLDYCIDCGCCTYVCPAKIPLFHWIKYGKSEVAKRVEE